MEDPTNLMMITGVFFFGQPLDVEEVKTIIEERLLPFDRFRMRIVQPAFRLRPYWEIDPKFDINAHLHRIALPSPGDQEILQDFVNDLMSTPLDYSKPLWQFHIIENYGDGCAFLCRLHHSIADGIALMRVLLSMTEHTAEPEVGSVDENEPSESNGSTTATHDRSSSKSPTFNGFAKFMTEPTRMIDAAKVGTESLAALGHLLTLRPDPQTPFKGELNVMKRCAWSQPISLSNVKEIGIVAGGTVNDVLISAVTGALRRYLHLRGEPAGGLNFRAVVPVNLRPSDEELKLGNAFGLVFLSLPVGIADPLDRLQELKRRMDGIKGTPEALVAFGILNAIGLASPEIQDVVVRMFGSKATAVMTNVPGPREVRYFAGQPITGLMFWVPQSGRLGLGISILSYAGEVLVGVATDAGLVPDPESLIEAFHTEFDDLMKLVNLTKDIDGIPVTVNGSIPDRCTAITKTGLQCKNRARAGALFCYVHQE
jgi:WS/DGAT/MGAT family acyltransferase